MSGSFEHFVSYGSTDQATMRELASYFDGLVVPGTIAAFQADGTRGFVLTLSARAEPYVIDSRFPLFQNFLVRPKKSHFMLADLLGSPQLVRTDRAPLSTDFDGVLIDTIASRWVDFNLGFDDVKSKTFDKYAARLQEEILPGDRQKPSFVMPPYTMVSTADDGWFDVSTKLWDASVAHVGNSGTDVALRRVLATSSAALWKQFASRIDEQNLVAWISGLDEFSQSSEADLVTYGEAIAASSDRGQSVFALYGGFFSVLLGRYGLAGSSHGIGFGEHRDWVELPSSGAPPARYYVPRLHRYVPVDLAEIIWSQFPALIVCDCQECGTGSPAALDYHALMKHSVLARDREIREWTGLTAAGVVERLSADARDFQLGIAGLTAPERILRRAVELYGHLYMWARVVKSLSGI